MKRTISVHPAADIFPMLPEDELTELAEDIKANGLLHPIVLDAEGQLVDGRNRLAACELAGIEPRFESLNGHDALAYIASANLRRRNLTKGQQAMALAMIYPEPGERGRGKKSAAIKSAETTDFSASRLRQARSILAFSRPMAESILKGAYSLDQALQQVEAEKQRMLGDDARLERLRTRAPDLADLVAEERMPLSEAIAALNDRDSRRRAAYQGGISAAERLTEFCAHVAAVIEGEEARQVMDQAAREALGASDSIRVKPEALSQITRALSVLTKFCGGK